MARNVLPPGAGTSHYALFHDEATLDRMPEALGAAGYRNHELGDSALLLRARARLPAGSELPAVGAV